VIIFNQGLPSPPQLFTSPPAMKIDNLEQYINVRQALIEEKAELEQRLRSIQAALGEAAQPAAPSTSTSGSASRRGRPPVGGGQSLREVVAGVLAGAGSPLTKQEVLDRVLRTGYKFTTNKPMNSLGVILYAKGNGFKRQNGRFTYSGPGKNTNTPAAQSNEGSDKTSAAPEGKAKSGGRRKMSAEAKARIRAAAQERWKKAKAEGRTRL
jgi:hypothetical protein